MRRTLSPGAKRSGREAGCSFPSNNEVKNAWSCAFTSPYVFMLLWLIEYSDNFEVFLFPLPELLASVRAAVVTRFICISLAIQGTVRL